MFQSEEMQVASQAAERLVGDPHPLAVRIGAPFSTDRGLANAVAPPPGVVDVASLAGFLGWYRRELLVPVEFPAIRRAWDHHARYELRELIDLDLRLAQDPRVRPFAAASRAVGRSQLRRLLPMRDQRLVRRYYEAVDCGRANGWHVLVYGVVLGLFSLPLRQGLQHYARQAVAGFIERAAGPLRLRVATCDRLFEEATVDLGTDLEAPCGGGRAPNLLICR